MNPAAKTKLNQSGDVDGGSAKGLSLNLSAPDVSAAAAQSASKKISLKVMTLNKHDDHGHFIGVDDNALCILRMNGGAVGDAMVSVAVGKVTPDWLVLMAKGIMCNVMVCLAVWIGFSARTVVDKVLGIMLPISFFVAAGFEHCVANMFFLPTGLLMKSAGFGAAVANAGALDVTAILYNLSAATVGNIIGGVLVGLAYWFVYARNKAK